MHAKVKSIAISTHTAPWPWDFSTPVLWVEVNVSIISEATIFASPPLTWLTKWIHACGHVSLDVAHVS